MMKHHQLPHSIARAFMIALAYLVPGFATGAPLTDLHDIAVGMSVQQLPEVGYRDLTCAGRSIAKWDDWASCPINAVDGLRAMHVAYDQPDNDTKVGGHPVDLTVFFDKSGRLAKIEIRTDDHVPLYLRKKAYMLARQARAHYGDDRWTCKGVPASEGEQPIGSIYINENCVKVSAERRIEVSHRLFRRKEGTPRDFVSDTTISINIVPTGLR